MRNKKIYLALPILALLLLVPRMVPFAYGSGTMVEQGPVELEAAEASVGTSQDMSIFTEGVAHGFDQPDHLYSEPAPAVPNDDYFDKQWALTKIQALDAWQVSSGSQDILIAVLDTGIDRTHIDLAGKVIVEINFTQSPTVDDVYGHGTHIAGIIGAVANNSRGIAGLAYDCSLMNVKVASDFGFCDAETVAEGIVWAVDNGAKVINLSLTLSKPDQALEDAVNYAWSKGAILICAAGNVGGSNPVYPAYYANCLTVTSTNSDDLPGKLATNGDWVDVAAPGVNIYSTLPDNGYGYKSGTSMAAAYVSGLAALLFSVAPDANGNGLLNDEVRYVIESSCDEIGILDVSKGRINALGAMQ